MVTAHSVRRLLAGTSSPSSVTRNAQCRPDTANRWASPVSCMATASPSGSSVRSPVSSAVRKPRTDGSSQTAAIRCPQGMDGPQRQPLHTAPAAIVHGGVLPLVQQGVHASGGELRQLRAPDAGGILPPCRAGQLLARLQRQYLPAAVVHSPGAEEAVKAHCDPAAPLRLLRPRADRGGKVVFRAAPRLHRLLHRRLIDGEIHQRRRQRPQYQLAAPEVPPLLRPQAQAQRRQADANRRPEVPAAPRQQQDKEQSRGEGESGSGQYAHTLSPPRR